VDDFDLNETPATAPAYDPAKCLERLGKLTASKAGSWADSKPAASRPT